MTIVCTPYMTGIVGLASGAINTDGAFYASLHTAAYTPDTVGHTARSHLSNEVTGTPYVAGGKPIPVSVYADYDEEGARVAIDEVRWNAATFTDVRYAVVYQYLGGVASADPLLLYVDFGEDIDPAGTDFVLSWSEGALLVRPAAL